MKYLSIALTLTMLACSQPAAKPPAITDTQLARLYKAALDYQALVPVLNELAAAKKDIADTCSAKGYQIQDPNPTNPKEKPFCAEKPKPQAKAK
jgi:hypothetical protein